MEKWTSEKLRKCFISFFTERGHKELPGISVVPPNDPTLLFTNSGMVQFKNIFLGAKPEHKRVCTVQRCIRAGGKHNDLDDVGKDNYHHTFFEMLGNWSFGDYFKPEAIDFAYEFLVDVLKLDPSRLYVTVYDEMDNESRKFWGKHFPEDRILSASLKDNFWEMGEFGPCGPCTEIHYDRVGGRDASALVNMDDPDVIEIWNIVFMEYNRTPSGLEPLKTKHVDTGIGFERLLSILMGVNSNYEIDSFQSIIKVLEGFCNKEFTGGKGVEDVAFRVLADHSRTMAVCLNDGVEFASDGVGYVLRRILRRAVRFAYDILGLAPGVLSKVVQHAAKEMGFSTDVTIVDREEALFGRTLKNGLARFNKMAETKSKLDAADVFLLYDTYGFPKDLTELMALEKGVEINLDGFEELRNKAKEMSRVKKAVVSVAFGFDMTDDSFKYTHSTLEAELRGVVSNNNLLSPKEAVGVTGPAFLVFDRTCFYAEKGGQVGDTGVIEFLDESGAVVGSLKVVDTKDERGYVLHSVVLEGGEPLACQRVKLSYNAEARAMTAANHSICHILYHFLRERFETTQRGSLVDTEKCRFDFVSEKLSDEVIKSLEEDMNRFIESDAKRDVEVVTLEEVKRDGSLQLDDEDYRNGVRIVSFMNGQTKVRDICGGTHVASTKEIKKARIMSETGIKAGIRRIVVVTGARADKVDANAKELLDKLNLGKRVSLDGLISVTDRNMLEKICCDLSKKIYQEVKNKTGEIVENYEKKVMKLRVKNLCENVKNKIVIHLEKNLENFEDKDIRNLLRRLMNLSLPENVKVAFAVHKDGKTFIQTKSSDLKGLCDAFRGAYPEAHFKQMPYYVYGVVTKELSEQDIFNVLNTAH